MSILMINCGDRLGPSCETLPNGGDHTFLYTFTRTFLHVLAQIVLLCPVALHLDLVQRRGRCVAAGKLGEPRPATADVTATTRCDICAATSTILWHLL